MSHKCIKDRDSTETTRRSFGEPVIARSTMGTATSRASALSQRLGNQGIRYLVQAKLALSKPDDHHEREADRVANAVMRMRSPTEQDKHQSSSANSISSAHQLCTFCEEEPATPSGTKAQRKEQPANAPPITPSVAANIHSIRGGGSALPADTRAFFESRFGLDFGDVRVHTCAQAEEDAESIDAKAFTLGNHIAFGRGQYAPASHEGRKLLAHELTHTVQQGALMSGRAIAQRKPREKSGPDQEIGTMQQVFVVRDKDLHLAGTLVKDLKEFKRKVMTTRIRTDWTLVLSIHGSGELLAAQAENPGWQTNKVDYKEADIEALFNGDNGFVAWRDQYGPTHLSLVSCQVGAALEGVLISNLTRAGADNTRQAPQGLGTGCKPMSRTTRVGGAPTTRAKFEKLAQDRQDAIREELRKLNNKWGYYGGPPVPDNQIVHYYYEEEPKGEWVIVEVKVGRGHKDEDLKPTGIPFWNRTEGLQGIRFRQLCDQGAGALK